MIVICFLKAKYHILKATNAQVQKGLAPRGNLFQPSPNRVELGRPTIYIYFAIKQQYKHNATASFSSVLKLLVPILRGSPAHTWVSLSSKGLLMHVMLFIQVSAHWIHGGRNQPFSKIQNIQQPLLLIITLIYFSFNIMLYFFLCIL